MADAPGVKITEVDVLRSVQGVPVDIHGAIGVTQRGPDDVARLVVSFDDFKSKYGGLYRGSYLPHLVRGFFDQGGTALFISRVVGAGCAKSSGSTKAQGGAANTLTLGGRYYGEYGNGITFSFKKSQNTLSVATAAVDTEITLTSVVGFEVGDVVVLSDGTNSAQRLVVGIDGTGKKLKLAAAVGFIFATANTTVKTATTHRAKTTLASSFLLASASIQFTVANPEGIKKGDLLFIATGALPTTYAFHEVRVTNVNGSLIFATKVNGIAGALTSMPIGAIVVVQNFDVTVGYEGASYPYRYLSMESACSDYVETRLSGSQNESDLVTIVDADNVEVLSWRILAYPGPVDELMTGGLDGSAPVDNDYIGANTSKTYKHGIRLFDATPEVSSFACPGVTSQTVVVGLDSYAQAHYMDFCGDTPLAADTMEELLEYRQITLGLNSSYSAIYAPWHREVNPETPGSLIELPPSCRELGIYSEVANRRGVQKAPANEPYRNVVELVAAFEETERAILNQAGVNIVMSFPGRGIRPFGSRTLFPGENGKQFVPIRRLTNYVKRSLVLIARDFNFEPITERLFVELSAAWDAFFRNLWKSGALYPQTNPAKAWQVILNAALNPPEVMVTGRVKAKVSFSPPPPAEVIDIELALQVGGISEIVEL